MTPGDLLKLFATSDEPQEVTVIATDYRYDGWLMMVGPKRSGAIRCVVEDPLGRLFIHNPSQIRVREPEA